MSRFQPTLPLRGATRSSARERERKSFQPTLPLRGATANQLALAREGEISTHAPLAGSDASCSPMASIIGYFNPRSPCGERRHRVDTRLRPFWISTHAPLAGSDRSPSRMTAPMWAFQPTLPLRGATAIYSSPACVTVNISDIAQKQKSPSQATSGKTARQPVRTSQRIHESLPFAPPMMGASTPQPPTTQRTGLFGCQSTKKPSASYPGLAP